MNCRSPFATLSPDVSPRRPKEYTRPMAAVSTPPTARHYWPKGDVAINRSASLLHGSQAADTQRRNEWEPHHESQTESKRPGPRPRRAKARGRSRPAGRVLDEG